jgi:CheY-like chemotaxis protein
MAAGQAADASELLELIQEHRPDLVVVDIRMPTPIAASSAQKYASRPRLNALGDAGRRLRRCATRSSTLLPVSAAECTVSENIAARGR